MTQDEIIKSLKEEIKRAYALIYEARDKEIPARPWKEKESLLQEADRITGGDRQASYGPPDQDFARTAKMWEALLETCITLEGTLNIPPAMVASCMIALKLSRECHQHKRDNWVDIAGYAKCGNICRECEEESHV